MGVISEDYIMGLLKDYVKTDQGKALVNDYLKDAFYGGQNLGGIDRDRLYDYLGEIEAELYFAIRDEIPSVARSRDSIDSSIQGWYEGYIYANITVDQAALHRDSLRKRNGYGRTGEGIEDILALHTHGYSLIAKRPWGYWLHAETMTEEFIGAKVHRDPNYFLTYLVESINRRLGDAGRAWLDVKYEIK